MSKFSNLIWSIKEIWGFDKRLLFIMVLEMVIDSVMPFPSILLSGQIVALLTSGNSWGLVLFCVAIMFGTNYLLSTLNLYLGSVKSYLFVKLSDKITNDLNCKCMSIDYEQFNDSATLDRIHSAYRIAQGNNYFTSLTIILSLLSKLITLIGVIFLMTKLNKWLLLVAIIIILLQALIQVWQIKVEKKHNLESLAEQRKVAFSSTLPMDVQKKKDIAMYAYGGLILRKIKSFQETMLSYRRHQIINNGLISMSIHTLTIAFQIAAYVILGLSVFSKEITIGDFTSGIASLNSFMATSAFLVTNVTKYNNSLFYIKRQKSFFKIRSKHDKISEYTIDDFDLTNVEIEFRNVSFRYPDSTSFVLKNINITLKKSEKLAVVGFNGAGKTSFVLLLTRMYDPTEGGIYLNGVNIRDINYSDYLKIFATVNQDFELLPFSLAENIAGKESLSDNEQESIVRLFANNGMGTRIEKLYKGLDTPVTKTLSAAGVDFSGGEKQKIAIIRALYKDSPVLILDEPTSALDPIAEYEIYQKFAEMAENKLTIYISHRISSTRFCDKIAVFDKGEIVEYGTFEELIEAKGLYYDFYAKQSEYFKSTE